jgi:hypothetical protein
MCVACSMCCMWHVCACVCVLLGESSTCELYIYIYAQPMCNLKYFLHLLVFWLEYFKVVLFLAV